MRNKMMELTKKVQEDNILFERIEEDLVTVATTSAALSQATIHNVNVLSDISS